MSKRELRREFFARVRSLSPNDRSERSSALRKSLDEAPVFRNARLVFAYLALPGEPDLGPLISAHPEKRWAFPRVTTEDRLLFHEIKGSAHVSKGIHGIDEPNPALHAAIDPTAADLILIPGVGFDPQSRARLGRGKGHYDRFLAEALSSPQAPSLIGLAFSEQLGALVSEDHDIPMDHILTDLGWI